MDYFCDSAKMEQVESGRYWHPSVFATLQTDLAGPDATNGTSAITGQQQHPKLQVLRLCFNIAKTEAMSGKPLRRHSGKAVILLLNGTTLPHQ